MPKARAAARLLHQPPPPPKPATARQTLVVPSGGEQAGCRSLLGQHLPHVRDRGVQQGVHQEVHEFRGIHPTVGPQRGRLGLHPLHGLGLHPIRRSKCAAFRARDFHKTESTPVSSLRRLQDVGRGWQVRRGCPCLPASPGLLPGPRNDRLVSQFRLEYDRPQSGVALDLQTLGSGALFPAPLHPPPSRLQF